MDETSRTFAGLHRLKLLGFAPESILDIGAHNGDWARGIRKIYPGAFIFMIDGLDEKREILDQSCRSMGNAEYSIALLGAEDKADTRFYVVNAGAIQTGSSRYRENTRFPVDERIVPQVTLNTVLSTRPPRRFALIKMDIQGGELDALAGAGRYLPETEVVLMEVALLPYNDGAPLFRDVVNVMHSYGFDLFDVLDEIRLSNGCLAQIDALFVRPAAAFRPRPPF